MYADKNGRVNIESASQLVAANSFNTTLVSASPGTKIVVLEAQLCSQGAASYIQFLSGNVNIRLTYIPANTVDRPNVELGPAAFGVLHTAAGDLLGANCGPVATWVNITYLRYTP